MATLTVGAGKQFATIKAAVAAAASGDTVAIDAGTYTNDFPSIGAKQLTLQGVGGMAHMHATVAIPNGKGFLVDSAGLTVDHMEFSGAKVSGKNGAGIRHEGGDLTISNSYFHDNQDGILVTPQKTVDTVSITASEFAHNGAGDGQSHNLYVNQVNHLNVDGSYFHDAVVGHEFKSRALETTITNSRFQDENGNASYSLDFPNGGKVSISGSVIQQSAGSQNPAMVSYGAEGGLKAVNSLDIVDDTAINDRAASSSVFLDNWTQVQARISSLDAWGLTDAQVNGGHRGPAAIDGTVHLDQHPVLDTGHPWL